MFHDNDLTTDPQAGPQTPSTVDETLDLTHLECRAGASGLRPTPSAGTGDDPLHFGEIDDALELVADGETGVLDGRRTSLEENQNVETEVDSLRRELGTARAELSRVRQAGMDGAGWFGLNLLGGNPSRRLEGMEAAVAVKANELKQLKVQIASARDLARETEIAKAKVTQLEETRASLQRQVEELQTAEASFADRARKLERFKEEESRLRESIDRLKGWVERLQEDADGYEAVIPVEAEKLAICRRDHAAVSAEIDSAQARMATLLSELESLQNRRDEDVAAAELARVELEELTYLCNLERGTSEALSQEVAQWRETLGNLQGDAKAAELNRDALRDQGDRLCVALKEVEAKQAAELGHLEQLTNQVINRKRELTETETQAQEALAELRSLQDQAAAERIQLAELKGLTETERQTFAGVVEDLEQAKTERDQLREEAALLRQQIDELGEMRALGSRELEALDATLLLRKAEVAGIESDLRQLDEARQGATAATVAQQARLDQVEADLEKRENELRLCTSEYEDTERAREKLAGEIEDATTDRDRLIKQCAAREEELASQRASLAEGMGNLVRLQTLVETRERELRKLEARLNFQSAEHDASMQRHREELEGVLKKVDEANTTLEAVTERIATEEANAEGFRAAREAEFAQLKSAETELRERTNQSTREHDQLEASVTQHREFLSGLQHQFKDLETSFQLRMEELQATRNKAEDELAAKITALNDAAARVDQLETAKRELAEVSAEYEKTLTLKERADERLRRSEDRERELYDRIVALEKRTASLRRIP